MRRTACLFHVLSVSASCVVVMATASCQPQLGQCDEEATLVLVTDRSGYPAYPGQALLQESCSSCHSVAASGTARRGAPAHLNFDAVGSRSDDPMTPDMGAVERLVVSRQAIFDHRFGMYSTVETGSMPPGDIGRVSVVDAGYTFLDGGDLLPTIQSAEGKELYRNWLACGSPMVTQSAEPSPSQAAGDPCDGTPYTLMDEEHCYFRRTEPPIDPTWTAIYDRIIVGSGCVSCHGPGPASFIMQSALDLSDKDEAYAALVGIEAMGMPCGPEGAADRVIPGDSDGSMLVHKLENEIADGSDVCGDPMPLGILLPPAQIAVVRQWIDDGAMDN